MLSAAISSGNERGTSRLSSCESIAACIAPTVAARFALSCRLKNFRERGARQAFYAFVRQISRTGVTLVCVLLAMVAALNTADARARRHRRNVPALLRPIVAVHTAVHAVA